MSGRVAMGLLIALTLAAVAAPGGVSAADLDDPIYQDERRNPFGFLRRLEDRYRARRIERIREEAPEKRAALREKIRTEDIEPFGDVPDTLCRDRDVLEKILQNFSWAEQNTWHRGFLMYTITHPRQRYTVLDGPQLIRHRHCYGRAVMTNGRSYDMYYVIEEERGFASIGDGITYCVAGLDPWHVYGRVCETMR